MEKNILLRYIFILFVFMFIGTFSVNAVEDSTKCYYVIPVPDNNNVTKNFEFIVKIGTYQQKTANCKMYFYDTKAYNDSNPQDPMQDENGNIIPGCYNLQNSHGEIVYTCGYYDCWADNNGYQTYNKEMNWMYDQRNGRYVYFHYGKEFYEQYYREGGKCPQLWGGVDNDQIFYLRLNQQLSTDKIQLVLNIQQKLKNVTINLKQELILLMLNIK